ncbi:MAG: selenide, water dikinase SelD [Bacteroidia bacterium]|nr:selenide, water dikinase SelD [Bacteroidia bacterium]
MQKDFPLTQFSKGSGCGCKIAPSVLQEMLQGATQLNCPALLIGNETKDDAAVYELEDGNCIISTTDFFTPIVNDAYTFGMIAAANAISDVYAMGGKPLMAVAILGWPIEKIPAAIAKQVLEGGRKICHEAGIPLAGGHSVDLPEPVFGLAVTGIVKKENIKKNNAIKENDILFITKPLGSGVLASALKRGILKKEHEEFLVKNLCALNKTGEQLGKKNFVHAMTDVTGFGLLGHLTEMTEDTKLCALIEKNKIPKLNGFDEYAAQFIYPENTTRNFSAYSTKCEGMNDLDFLLFCDPQTNGGLLFSANEKNRTDVLGLMKECGQEIWEIGKIISKEKNEVVFV